MMKAHDLKILIKMTSWSRKSKWRPRISWFLTANKDSCPSHVFPTHWSFHRARQKPKAVESKLTLTHWLLAGIINNRPHISLQEMPSRLLATGRTFRIRTSLSQAPPRRPRQAQICRRSPPNRRLSPWWRYWFLSVCMRCLCTVRTY